jgi:hypothetical protein
MPTKKIPAEVALRNLKTRAAIWPARGKANRKGCLPLPTIKPSFHIFEGDRVFCMGSCFAAHIGGVLAGLGFDVVTDLNNPLQEGHWAGSNHLIRYNVFSILNEFQWALQPDAVAYESLFVEEENGLFMDPYGHYQVHPHPKDHLIALREFTGGVTRRLPECRIVLLTLGMTEVWFDEKNCRYLNIQPSRYAIRKEPDRFCFHILSFEDVARALEELHVLLQESCHPDVRILVTTSPVPLHATYSEQDVFVANMHSKCTQRAAVGEFVERHANVDYFPSYETVMLGNPEFVWQEDQRHVAEMAVSAIMEQVVRCYAPEKRCSTSTIAQLERLDEQLNGLQGRFLWDKISELTAKLEGLRAELATETVNINESK